MTRETPPGKYRLVRETPEEAAVIARIYARWNRVEWFQALAHNANGAMVLILWIALAAWVAATYPLVWAGLAGCSVATWLGKQVSSLVDHHLFYPMIYRLKDEVDEVYAIQAEHRPF